MGTADSGLTSSLGHVHEGSFYVARSLPWGLCSPPGTRQRGQFSDTEGPQNAIDGRTSTRWHSTVLSPLVIKMPKPAAELREGMCLWEEEEVLVIRDSLSTGSGTMITFRDMQIMTRKTLHGLPFTKTGPPPKAAHCPAHSFHFMGRRIS